VETNHSITTVVGPTCGTMRTNRSFGLSKQPLTALCWPCNNAIGVPRLGPALSAVSCPPAPSIVSTRSASGSALQYPAALRAGAHPLFSQSSGFCTRSTAEQTNTDLDKIGKENREMLNNFGFYPSLIKYLFSNNLASRSKHFSASIASYGRFDSAFLCARKCFV
jgi:hypothetical protein